MTRVAEDIIRLGHKVVALEEGISRVRFCRNVQRTREEAPEENARRLRQLEEAVDYLINL